MLDLPHHFQPPKILKPSARPKLETLVSLRALGALFEGYSRLEMLVFSEKVEKLLQKVPENVTFRASSHLRV